MKVLVLGGAGYIGSNLCYQLNRLGAEFAIFDDFKNTYKSNITRLKKAVNTDFVCIEGDCCDKDALDKVFALYRPDAVVHYANKKYLPDSVQNSLDYYENNLISTFNTLRMCEKYNVNKLLFASSVTVYSHSDTKLTEDQPRELNNPYVKTKVIAEDILKDWQYNNPDKCVIITRYTNPVGANNGLGDRPTSQKINVLPYLINSVREGTDIVLNGGKMPTKDGSAVRDFIHISDLTAITATLLTQYDKKGCFIVNVGTGGDGYSVKELAETVGKVLNTNVEYSFNGDNTTDKCSILVNTERLNKEINITINYGLEDIIKSQIDLKQEGEENEEV